MSPNRAWRLFAEDIRDSVLHIQSYVADMTVEQFRKNLLAQDVVVMRFVIIGEAGRHIPEAIKLRHADLPWTPMRGMRNFSTHSYWNVEPDIVWNTV